MCLISEKSPWFSHAYLWSGDVPTSVTKMPSHWTLQHLPVLWSFSEYTRQQGFSYCQAVPKKNIKVKAAKDIKLFILFYFFGGWLFYNIVLVLPYINMNPPQGYTCSPSWTPLPPHSPYQCTSPKHPVSCIEPGLAICYIYEIIQVSMPFSQIIPPLPSATESNSASPSLGWWRNQTDSEDFLKTSKTWSLLKPGTIL